MVITAPVPSTCIAHCKSRGHSGHALLFVLATCRSQAVKSCIANHPLDRVGLTTSEVQNKKQPCAAPVDDVTCCALCRESTMASSSSWTQDVSCKAIAATSHAHGLSTAPTARPSALSMMLSRMCTGKQPFVILVLNLSVLFLACHSRMSALQVCVGRLHLRARHCLDIALLAALLVAYD